MLEVTAAVTDQKQPENATGATAGFVVENVGTTTIININLTCAVTGPLACGSVSPSYVSSLTVGQSIDVEVSYATGSAGTGSVKLTATGKTGSPAYDQTGVTVLASPVITLAAPIGASSTRKVVRTRQPRVTALLTAGTSDSLAWIDSTSIQLTWRGVDVTAQARINRGLLEWEPNSAQGLGTVGSSTADSAALMIRVCSFIGGCTTIQPYVVLPNDSKPVLGFTGVPYEALGRAFRAPFGPGLSVTAGEIEAGVSTVPYVSMGTPRSTGLVYSTRQSYPRVLVPVDLELTWPAGTPDDLTFVLKDGGTRLDSVRFVSPTCATGAVRRCRAVLQGDFSASTFSTATRKWLTVEGRVKSGGTTNTSIDSVEVVLVDRRATRYGAGWWPTAGVQLVAAGSDRLLVSATGAVSVFRGNGDSLFLAPPGSEVVLRKVGATFEMSPRGSLAKSVYDASGRLVYAEDINGNRDSVKWEGATDKILKVKDPVGKEITFHYDSLLGTFTYFASLSGAAERRTKVSINATTNQLTRDSVPASSGAIDTTKYIYKTYPGTKTVVLTKRIGVLTDTTVVVYDSTVKRRPVQVQLPLVQDSSGAWLKPTISYTAREYQGIAALRALDSTYVQMTDPRGFWSRSLVNRWGQAVRTWDTLGTLARAAYRMDGRPVWTEGVVPDSSRVWTQYDTLRRVVKTFWVRSASDTLRLDSLVYDTQHRVIQTIDSRGKSSSIAYDAAGNPIRTVGPANDTSSVVYLADGRVDSTRTSGAGPMHYTYDATWKNRANTYGPASQLLGQTYYDHMGRDTLSQSKLRVRQTADSTQWQWRKVRTWYTVSNQVDSTRLMRGDNCPDPCASPSYPGTFDSLHQVTTGWRRDSAGRDTARVDSRGKATTYRLDRLGRVVARRPWADSAIVKDSLVYDLAGNVVKAITRRGYAITTHYDSRNRDTLAVIPTVGTLRKAFAGPAGQLTRQWLESPVDSIGGVNGELRWGYDQRGRLLADTAYSGAVPRPQSYTYDLWERANTRTDTLGTWTTRFETARGVPDTLETPLGDALSLGLDPLLRPTSMKNVGPTGTAIEWLTRAWNSSGELASMEHAINVFSSPTWTALSMERITAIDSGGPPLGPQWLRQDGAYAVADTLRDTVAYDGWQRVTSYVLRVSPGPHAPLLSLTYSFDPMGNRRTPGGGEVYNAVTNQLRVVGANTLSYDAAGNLIARSSGAWAYGYDALERLVSVRKSGVLIARYGYDVAGRRIVKRVYSGTTGGTVGYLRMVYAGNQVAFETDSNNTAVSTIYTWGPGVDNLIGLTVNDTAYTAVTDPLGSVRALVRRSGGVWVGRLLYDPYGQLVDSAGPQIPIRYRWTGREWDAETGLYFHRSRFYDPTVGRFIQEDPIGFGGGGNLYSYVSGNVLQAKDPNGLRQSADRYAWPYDCCGKWANQWDGWFGIMGSILPIPVYFATLSYEGTTTSFILPRSWSNTDALTINLEAGKPLSDAQLAGLGNLCQEGSSLCSSIRLFTAATWLNNGRSLTLGRLIFVAWEADAAVDDIISGLAHEVTHTVQYAIFGFDNAFGTLMAEQAMEQAYRHFGIGQNPYDWTVQYRAEPLRSFGSYYLEGQAQMVQDCFAARGRASSVACQISPFGPGR